MKSSILATALGLLAIASRLPIPRHSVEIHTPLAAGSRGVIAIADGSFHITRPGVYHLISNVTCDRSPHVIEIHSHHVILDLNGFTISGEAIDVDPYIESSGYDDFRILNRFIKG